MNKFRAAVIAACLALSLSIALVASASAAPSVSQTPQRAQYGACDHVFHTFEYTQTTSGDGSFQNDVMIREWVDAFGNYCDRIQPVMKWYGNNVFDWGDHEHVGSADLAIYNAVTGYVLGEYSNWGVDWDVVVQDSGQSFWYYGPYISTVGWGRVSINAFGWVGEAPGHGDGTSDSNGHYTATLTYPTCIVSYVC